MSRIPFTPQEYEEFVDAEGSRDTVLDEALRVEVMDFMDALPGHLATLDANTLNAIGGTLYAVITLMERKGIINQ